MTAASRIAVLFVCTGNICRSPLAEGVFRELVERRGLSHRFEIDSAGTEGYHVGEEPDPRTQRVALQRGLRLTSRARKLRIQDLVEFDLIVAMDGEHVAALKKLAARCDPRARVVLLREYDPERDDLDVPDPYYGGERGFETVHDIIERSCERLLEAIVEERGIG